MGHAGKKKRTNQIKKKKKTKRHTPMGVGKPGGPGSYLVRQTQRQKHYERGPPLSGKEGRSWHGGRKKKGNTDAPPGLKKSGLRGFGGRGTKDNNLP